MRALSIRAFGAASGVLLCGLLAGTARSADDGPLTRSPSNPLLSRGPSGSFDQIKIGPRAILDEGPSDWKMWYEGVPAGNQSVAGYATSTDGLTWTKYAGNPVMTPTQTWEGVGGTNHETSPSTVLKEGGVYKMWYHGIEGTTRRIGYATSSDGITWTHYAGNPVLDVGANGEWDAGGIGEPKVIHVGSTYVMYYVHTVDPGGVGLATSADGVT
jgi:predicted GH43/DUF377 family glycosyl hydrolase